MSPNRQQGHQSPLHCNFKFKFFGKFLSVSSQVISGLQSPLIDLGNLRRCQGGSNSRTGSVTICRAQARLTLISRVVRKAQMLRLEIRLEKR
jgi:hypothetical protein